MSVGTSGIQDQIRLGIHLRDREHFNSLKFAALGQEWV